MTATIVVGGQYGSEGKGKVVALLASRSDSPWIVRCGGPNSGHTVSLPTGDVVLRQVPSTTTPSKGTYCIAAGCVVDEGILLQELEMLAIDRERIIVDPRAALIVDGDSAAERLQLSGISSTFSGTGSALVRRMSRMPDVPLANSSSQLAARCRVESVAPLLHTAIDRHDSVIVEGTQGFGLSLLHGPDYPYLTARDTTAAGFAMEVGLSPRLVDKIVVVVRTFPIRVGGPSGPLKNEITWEDVRRLSGAPTSLPELTSVTRKLRRVARFDLDAVRLACEYNRPTSLAVMGLDRLEYSNTGITDPAQLSNLGQDFLDMVSSATGVPVEFAGTGFGTHDVAVLPTTADTHFAHA